MKNPKKNVMLGWGFLAVMVGALLTALPAFPSPGSDDRCFCLLDRLIPQLWTATPRNDVEVSVYRSELGLNDDRFQMLMDLIQQWKEYDVLSRTLEMYRRPRLEAAEERGDQEAVRQLKAEIEEIDDQIGDLVPPSYRSLLDVMNERQCRRFGQLFRAREYVVELTWEAVRGSSKNPKENSERLRELLVTPRWKSARKMVLDALVEDEEGYLETRLGLSGKALQTSKRSLRVYFVTVLDLWEQEAVKGLLEERNGVRMGMTNGLLSARRRFVESFLPTLNERQRTEFLEVERTSGFLDGPR